MLHVIFSCDSWNTSLGSDSCILYIRKPNHSKIKTQGLVVSKKGKQRLFTLEINLGDGIKKDLKPSMHQTVPAYNGVIVSYLWD